MKSILLVEDDVSLGGSLVERLQTEGYEIHWARTCSEAEALRKTELCDLAILDVSLPDGDGFSLAKTWKEKNNLPVLFLTASTGAEDRLRGFELGAEEYIPKPFHFRELLLRLENVLKRNLLPKQKLGENLWLSSESRTLEASSGRNIPLNSAEYLTLKLLLDRSPKIVSRADILDLVYGPSRDTNFRSVDNVVVRLRKILGNKDAISLRSIRGEGYQWLPIEEQANQVKTKEESES